MNRRPFRRKYQDQYRIREIPTSNSGNLGDPIALYETSTEESCWRPSCRLLAIQFEHESEGIVPKTAYPGSRFASATCVEVEKSTVAISNQNPGSTSSTPAS